MARTPILVNSVIYTIKELNEDNGSTIAKLCTFILKSPGILCQTETTRDHVNTDVRKAIEFGLEKQLFEKGKNGRYKIMIKAAVEATTTSESKNDTEDNMYNYIT